MSWGPCTDPNLNGSHPALLAALRSNCDAQLPFRFPITVDTHSSAACKENCDSEMPARRLVKEAQMNQAAQAGYACDYQNKRLPVAVHEVKEWMKGQQHLYEELKDNKTGYLGARSAKRLITDCYGRGVVRGAVETSHLITQTAEHDPTAAESIKSAQVTEMTLQYPLQLLVYIAARSVKSEPWPREPSRVRIDRRNPAKPKVVDCPLWTMYGGRGKMPQVHGLSAYEFQRHFCMKQAVYPRNVKQHEQNPEAYEALLTPEGIKLLELSESRGQVVARMAAGKHYTIREEGGQGWVPLGNGKLVQAYRHDWVIAARRRPYAPVIFGAQSSKTVEEQAMRVLVLFFPWVNNAAEASPSVPFLEDLWRPGPDRSWTHALLKHASLHGFPTDEIKRLFMNFVFTYCLPRQTRVLEGLEENSDNEDLVDTLDNFVLDEDELLEASLTCVRGGTKDTEKEPDQVDLQGSESECDDLAAGLGAGKTTRLYDMTMEMFRLSAAACKRYEDMMEHGGDTVHDHELAKQSAAASRKWDQANADSGRVGLIGDAGAVVQARARVIHDNQLRGYTLGHRSQ